MANELSIITTNQAGDGWIDQTPGPVSSGYQAQNTMISSTLIGIDQSIVRSAPSRSGTSGSVIIEPSGPISINGLPFMITSQVTLSVPRLWAGMMYFYIVVFDGDTWDKKNLETMVPIDPPVYDHVKQEFYLIHHRSGGNDVRVRCLNWIVYVDTSLLISKPFRLIHPGQSRLQIENFMNIDGTETDFNIQIKPGDKALFLLSGNNHYRASDHRKRHEVFIRKPVGKIGGTFRIKFNVTSSGHSDMVGFGVSLQETGGSRTIIKYRRRSGRNLTPVVFSGDFPFSPNSNIELHLDVQYHGSSNNSRYANVINFQICASQGVSSYMSGILDMGRLLAPGRIT